MSEALKQTNAQTSVEGEVSLGEIYAEMERLQKQMDADRADIRRLKAEIRALRAETRAILSTLKEAPSTASIVHPLAHLAGKYADEPMWDDYMQAIEEYRQSVDTQEAAGD